MQRALELDVEDPAARDRSGWVAARLATADVREHELCMPPRDEESLAVHVLVAVLPDPRPRHAGSGAERRREPRRTRGEEREPVGSLVDEVDRGAVHVTEERVARSSPVVQRRRYPVSVDVVAVVAEREEAGDDAAAPERSDPEVVGGACDPLDVGRRRPVELQPSDASRPRSRCRRRRAAPLSRPPQRLSPRSLVTTAALATSERIPPRRDLRIGRHSSSELSRAQVVHARLRFVPPSPDKERPWSPKVMSPPTSS
jgi:hypothetical protein